MAAQVNTRLILILISAFGFVGALLGGTYYLQARKDATRHAEKAEAAMAEGDLERALVLWRRAVGRDSTNTEYMDSWEGCLTSMVPGTTDRARELYMQYIGVMAHRAAHIPLEADNHLRYVEEVYNAARLAKVVDWWSPVLAASESMRDSLPADDPAMLEAELYRGLALTAPSMRQTVREEGLKEAISDLEELAEAYPDDPRVWAALLDAYRTYALDLRDDGLSTRAGEALERAAECRERAVETGADNAEALMAVLQFDSVIAGSDPGAVDLDVARGMARDLVTAVAARDEAWVAPTAATVMGTLTWLPGRPSQVEILDGSLERFPDRYDQHLLRSRWYYATGDFDKSMEAADIIVKAPPETVSFIAMYQEEFRRRAASTQVDIALRNWERAEPANRAARLAELRTYAEFVEDQSPNPDRDSLVLAARGKVAYAERDYATAARYFDELASERLGEIDFEILLYAADCLEREGSIGRALEYIDRAITLKPADLNMRLQRADLLEKMRRYGEALTEVKRAQSTVEALVRRDPNNTAATDFLTALARIERRIVGRENASNPEANLDNRRVLEQAQALVTEEDFDTARTLLTSALAKTPNDLLLLNAIVRTEFEAGNRDAARSWLDKAMELEPGHGSFRNLDVLLKTDDPIERLRLFADLSQPNDSRKGRGATGTVDQRRTIPATAGVPGASSSRSWRCRSGS